MLNQSFQFILLWAKIQVWVKKKTHCLSHFLSLKFLRPCQFSSVAQLCLTLCDLTDCSIPGFPVHHQLPELAQTHVHLVGDAIQSSHPLSSPSPPAFSLSQHQGLFQWDSSWHQVAKVLELRLVSVLSIQDWFPLGFTGLIFLQSKGLKSLLQHHSSFLCGPTLTSIHDYWKNHSFDYLDLCWQSNVSAF